MEDNEIKCVPQKIIICEGQSDEVILQAIARKLNCQVRIVSAGGKGNVPIFFNALHKENKNACVLIVVDSDGDEQQTKKMLEEKIKEGSYQLAIINNKIEDWFTPNIA